MMAVIRVNKSKDFTVMSNAHFREKEMSLKAKGLISLMLSLPDDWDYSINGLCALSKDGYESVMNALKELESFGYLKRTRSFDEKGRFAGYDYDIYENPSTEKPCTGKPITENPSTEKPCTGNQGQYNTNLPNTEEVNTKGIKKERKSASKPTTYDAILSTIEDPDLRELYLEYIKMRKLIKAPMTDKALQMLISKVERLEPQSIDRQKKLLETAIVNNWKSVYPLKDDAGSVRNERAESSPPVQGKYGTYL